MYKYVIHFMNNDLFVTTIKFHPFEGIFFLKIKQNKETIIHPLASYKVISLRWRQHGQHKIQYKKKNKEICQQNIPGRGVRIKYFGTLKSTTFFNMGYSLIFERNR